MEKIESVIEDKIFSLTDRKKIFTSKDAFTNTYCIFGWSDVH